MVNMNNLLNGKDSRWLQLEVCREFQRNKCTRPDTECKFAHPPANVEVQNGRVTACYDSIKVTNRCIIEFSYSRVTSARLSGSESRRSSSLLSAVCPINSPLIVYPTPFGKPSRRRRFNVADLTSPRFPVVDTNRSALDERDYSVCFGIYVYRFYSHS